MRRVVPARVIRPVMISPREQIVDNLLARGAIREPIGPRQHRRHGYSVVALEATTCGHCVAESLEVQNENFRVRSHLTAYVKHTSAYVKHTSAYVKHTSAYVSIRQAYVKHENFRMRSPENAYVKHRGKSIRQA